MSSAVFALLVSMLAADPEDYVVVRLFPGASVSDTFASDMIVCLDAATGLYVMHDDDVERCISGDYSVSTTPVTEHRAVKQLLASSVHT